MIQSNQVPQELANMHVLEFVVLSRGSFHLSGLMMLDVHVLFYSVYLMYISV